MRLRKKHGGCSIGGHEWAEDGAVAEVPDDLGTELLELAPGEYEHIFDDAPTEDEPAPAEESGDAEPEPEAVEDQPATATRAPQSRPKRR